MAAFLKNERKITTGIFFVLLCTFFTGGLPADGITAMVIKESSLIYCVRLFMVPQLLSVELLVAEDACTSRGGDQG